MKALLTLLAALSIFTLAACDDHPGEHCTHSHPETIYVNAGCQLWIKSGNSQICASYFQIPVQTQTCDTWAPDDPSTVKPTHGDAQ